MNFERFLLATLLFIVLHMNFFFFCFVLFIVLAVDYSCSEFQTPPRSIPVRVHVARCTFVFQHSSYDLKI